MELSILLGVSVAFITALLVVVLMHPQVVKFAIKRNIVDNPDARKLQRSPVPVMGGVAVFFGLISGLCVASIFMNISQLLPIFVAMSVMLCVGVADDVANLSARLRFLIEIAVALMVMFWTGGSLNDFQGLWGINEVSLWISVPLTIISVVGIINALNLVDGVDGLSSGYCILASVGFFTLFYKVDDYPMLLLSALSIGALLPFFFHNVFGHKTKMFIGDGGSLMMGVIMSAYVLEAISTGGPSEVFVESGLGLVAFTLAVMCVPVFDTLRVMLMRIIRGVSPFSPDKTHLHHLFIELGFSHVGTTISELLLNLIVVMVWYATYQLGGSIDLQFYVVVGTGLLLTAGFYKTMRISMKHDWPLHKFMQRVGACTHLESNKGWRAIQKFVDLQ
jgi:UDP-N-acetylmuramyl pentapeptide phosphotransferase/UDP-N-acetylglucosamine-1-phosphate transferase